MMTARKLRRDTILRKPFSQGVRMRRAIPNLQPQTLLGEAFALRVGAKWRVDAPGIIH